jgi:hypothetical protein
MIFADIELNARLPGAWAAAGKTNHLRKTESVLYLSHLRSLTFAALQHTARRGDSNEEWDLKGSEHNPGREFERRPIFFIPIARNPLKSPDSKK